MRNTQALPQQRSRQKMKEMHERRNYRVPFRMMDIKLCERSCLHIFVILQS